MRLQPWTPWYTYVDETDGERYLRRYDALRLYVGYNKDGESALVQVTDITYNEGVVEYHLGLILEKIAWIKETIKLTENTQFCH